VTRRQAFGPYDLVERVGVGALGEVYRAWRRGDRRAVALKRISFHASQDRDVLDALAGEAELGKLLDHPAIAKVVDVGTVGGVHYIAYEYVHGRDLRALHERAMASGGLIPIDVTLYIIQRVCEALGHAHGRSSARGEPLGMVHLDVKPENIMISIDGEVKLLDFGIARVDGRRARGSAGYVSGTMGYMSPEQVRDEPVDGRADLYALGVCLWELVTGRRLFGGTQPAEVARRILEGDIAPPRTIGAQISPALERIILKTLANSADQRYLRAAELQADLCELTRAEGTLTDPTRVARYVRSVFPDVAANDAACREECPDMADNKGGSDLDVFEGLAKKPTRPATPGLAPPPSTQSRMPTLMGGLGPLPPPSAPPGMAPPPGALPAPLPPPKPPASTMPGMPSSVLPAPLPPPTAAPLPAPLPPPKTPLPPPVEAKPAPTGKAVDMDWDDEDESTHVYDKQMHDVVPTGPRPAAGAPPASKVSAAAALLASSGGAAPSVKAPPMPAGSQSAPPLPPVPAMPSSQPEPATKRAIEETAVRPRPVVPASGGSRAGVILGGLSLVVVLALAAFLLMPKKGQIKINVAGKDGASVPVAEVYIDGQKRCDNTPCVVADLEPGAKSIKVVAPGTPPLTKELVETIESGKEKVVLMTLDGAAGAASAATATQSTELKINATEGQKNVKVSVDGAEKGTLPVELKDLAPGTHKLKFDGGERYEKLEQSVEIAAGQSKDLGAIKLKVLKGQVTLELGTQGASVTLVRRDGDKKVEKKLPDSLWKSPPVKIDVDPNEGWKIVATKKGYDDFVKDLAFDDGVAEKTIKIDLYEVGKAAEAAKTAPVGGPVSAPAQGGNTTAPAPAPAPAAASGSGTLNINSIPVSKVVLDGRPLGSTPKVGVSVSAGSHTVTFIHPEKGKKSVTVQVKAGETKTAAVRF